MLPYIIVNLILIRLFMLYRKGLFFNLKNIQSTHQAHEKELEYIQIFNQKRVEGIILYATHLDSKLVKLL